MEIARIFFFIALYSLVACWLCNIMTLFSRPHKWCELLIFPQLVWFALGIIVLGYGEIYFASSTVYDKKFTDLYGLLQTLTDKCAQVDFSVVVRKQFRMIFFETSLMFCNRILSDKDWPALLTPCRFDPIKQQDAIPVFFNSSFCLGAFLRISVTNCWWTFFQVNMQLYRGFFMNFLFWTWTSPDSPPYRNRIRYGGTS